MYTPGPQQYQVAETPQVQSVPQPQDKPKAPAKSKPNGDIGAFIQQCISLCAHLEELRTQAHLIHLNYEAPNFFGVHEFLKEQYEAHQVDVLKEALFRFQLERDGLTNTPYELSLILTASANTSTVHASMDWEVISR